MAMDMPNDRYFFIQNPASGLVLEVDSGYHVKTGHRISDFSKNKCQLWYWDNLTIRNKEYNLYMDASTANAIKVNPYYPGSAMQEWVFAGKRLHLQYNSESAINISGEGESLTAGCDVIIGRQGLELEFVYTSSEKRLFYIVNCDTGHVMDVAQSDMYNGAQVITFPKSKPPRNSQLWYHGEHGCIHSRLNDFVLTDKGERMRTEATDIMLCPYDPKTEGQTWECKLVEHEYLIRKTSDVKYVLDTKGHSFFQIMNRLTGVVVSKKQDMNSQRWTFEYLGYQDEVHSHPRTGKLFLIRCFKYPTLVFSLEGDKQDEGTAVVLAEPEPGHSGGRSLNHLWYLDNETNTVRSAANDYCLDALEGKVVLNPYVPSSHTQKLEYDNEKNTFKNPSDGLMFQIDGDIKPSARIVKAHGNETPAQKFVINHVQAVYFYIKNDITGKVMEVERGDKDVETAVVLATQVDGYPHHQLWYEDENGLIRSALNGYAFSGQEGSHLKMMPLNPLKDKHQWRFREGGIIRELRGTVADVHSHRHHKQDVVRIYARPQQSKRNQKWFKVEPKPLNYWRY